MIVCATRRSLYGVVLYYSLCLISTQWTHSTVQPPFGTEQISQMRTGLTFCITAEWENKMTHGRHSTEVITSNRKLKMILKMKLSHNIYTYKYDILETDTIVLLLVGICNSAIDIKNSPGLNSILCTTI